MQTFRQTLNDFKPNGIATTDFNAALASFLMMEQQLPNNECIVGFQEDLIVEAIFCDEIINGPITLPRMLCDYISLKEFDYRPQPNTTKFIFGIAHCFFVKRGSRFCFKKTSIVTLVTSRHFKKVKNSSDEQPYIVSWLQDNDKRTAQDMLQRIENKDKLTGALGQDINEHLTNYEEACRNYQFTE